MQKYYSSLRAPVLPFATQIGDFDSDATMRIFLRDKLSMRLPLNGWPN